MRTTLFKMLLSEFYTPSLQRDLVKTGSNPYPFYVALARPQISFYILSKDGKIPLLTFWSINRAEIIGQISLFILIYSLLYFLVLSYLIQKNAKMVLELRIDQTQTRNLPFTNNNNFKSWSWMFMFKNK